MPQDHTVAHGEGLSSIAETYGFSPDRIWKDPANEELRRARPDPEVLAAGDVVVIPDRVAKEVQAPTGRRHTFRRVGVPALFSLKLTSATGPRAGEPYVLEVGDRRFEGTTDEHGVIRHYVPPAARSALLTLGTAGERFDIEIGGMDPLSELSGVQKRLNNLGFACGEADGALNAATAAALRQFQASRGLEATGTPDAATLRALTLAHDRQSGQPPAR